MLEKIKSVITAALLVGLTSCGGGDSLSGEMEGTTKLSRIYYGSDASVEIAGGKGTVSFPSATMLRFGANTPLPDCNLGFTQNGENSYGVDWGMQYKGESNDGHGSQFSLPGAAPGRVDIYDAKLKRDAESGIVTL